MTKNRPFSSGVGLQFVTTLTASFLANDVIKESSRLVGAQLLIDETTRGLIVLNVRSPLEGQT